MRRIRTLLRRRLRQERGAVAIITALSMVVLLGCAAMVIDAGSIYFERTQLQTGADAAALAIAQNCAAGNCGDPNATATALAGQNNHTNSASGTATLDLAANTVTVNTGTLTAAGQHVLTNTFGAILGIPTSTVTARATASWGSPAAATVFPFTTPRCIYDQTPPGQVLWITTTSSCTDASGNVVPGGFGWLDQSSPCAAVVDLTAEVGSQPGKSGPPCNMSTIVNTTILIPVYAVASGQGTNATYSISGFAAFHVTDWSWPGSYTQSPSAACDKCTGIRGYFSQLVTLDSARHWSVTRLGGPALNASFVSLSQ
jgi:Flp pilus assembly protein TadG